ncbi:MAG: hypothetical protein M3Z20_10715 [Chloroflexota bacterium]|nr:hypothetical protein [Chloroflexota bacterium]
MAQEPRFFDVDSNEIDRYARAIARILERGDAAGSVDRERAVNTYGTAFQLLVMRRGAEYGRALGMAAGDMAIGLAEAEEEMRALVAGDIAAIHERVCLAEEDAARAAAEAEANAEVDGSEEDLDPAPGA